MYNFVQILIQFGFLRGGKDLLGGWNLTLYATESGISSGLMDHLRFVNADLILKLLLWY